MIRFSCPGCRKQFAVPDQHAGRAAKCSCGELLKVPAAPVALPPLAAAVKTALSPTTPTAGLSLRERRLLADRRELEATFAGHPIVTIQPMGETHDRYHVQFAVTSLVGLRGETPIYSKSHEAEIELTSDYPRFAPRCRMLTPSFHPNIDATSICIGDHWSAGERLSDLILRIAEMLAFQAYNIRSPLNANAAMWADLHAGDLPIDARDLRGASGKL